MTPPRRRESQAGQGLVEFSFAVSIFLMLLMGIVDLGRAVYTYTGVSEAAREIARATSVHPGSTLGASPETQAAVSTQQRLVPGLTIASYECIDIAGAPVSGTCQPGNWIRVRTASSFNPVLPLLAAIGPLELSATSSAKIE
jgi:hypothetical protein